MHDACQPTQKKPKMVSNKEEIKLKLFTFCLPKTFSPTPCKTQFSSMLKTIRRRLRWPPLRSRPAKSTVIIRRFSKPSSKDPPNKDSPNAADEAVRANDRLRVPDSALPIRVATFNAAMFSMAPAVPDADALGEPGSRSERWASEANIRGKSANDRPKSILKRGGLRYGRSTSSPTAAKLRVSINLPDNEISLERSRQLSFSGDVDIDSGEASTSGSSTSTSRDLKGKAPLKASMSFPKSSLKPTSTTTSMNGRSHVYNRSVLDVLREVDADILALQNVKAEEEKGMRPLSDLAEGLGMKYVFAESWAPEYGNAILSKWPIKRWCVQKIFDDTDFRNVVKATIQVPRAGLVNFHCTHLDHLDENWRMKQINAILESDDEPHILAGGLNSLDGTDYSTERWADIVKYYEEIGKPKPKVDAMKFLIGKQYLDAKHFTGECESVVVIAKGQDVQGTCKYGTRVDYIMASPNSPYKFMPGSYAVLSSKGTSDHHIVKVDLKVADVTAIDNGRQTPKQRVVRGTDSTSKGIWKTD
ncbi:hypothetical protein QJS10_CPA05g00571 [Acorus calamus]|uniref:Endonuclease/exonuclease/phosphatase domain-containing protein n=1 Tax=Acorus calamus TaxID=4465 RepID=A0AAV9EY58_ACOCL|nr:hypothetical protein QJS10_CPA05g00571 [Acorus calamus]